MIIGSVSVRVRGAASEMSGQLRAVRARLETFRDEVRARVLVGRALARENGWPADGRHDKGSQQCLPLPGAPIPVCAHASLALPRTPIPAPKPLQAPLPPGPQLD